MKVTKITLEDLGQDCLEFYVDEIGRVVDVQPFQATIWRGAYIPRDKSMMQVGKLCPMHNPPYLEYSYLKYKIESIEEIKDYPCKPIGD